MSRFQKFLYESKKIIYDTLAFVKSPLSRGVAEPGGCRAKPGCVLRIVFCMQRPDEDDIIIRFTDAVEDATER
jgi:hypothetical protein